MSSDYSHLKSEIEKTGQTILKIAQQTNNTAIAEFLDEVLDKLPEEESYLAMSGLFKKEMLGSGWSKLEKSASDLMTYFLLEINSLTLPLDLEHLRLDFEQYLDLIEQMKRELFCVLEEKVEEIVSMLDEDLAVFKKKYEATLVKQVEEFVEGKLKSEKATSEKVVGDVEAYLRKTLTEAYSVFIRYEDMKVGSRFQQLANEANEKMNTLIGDVKQKAAELFEFRVITLVFHSSLNFETRSYYHMDPILITDITLSGDMMAESSPKSLIKAVLKKRIQEMARTEFAKNCEGIRYYHFIVRLDQAVLKLKKDINRAFEASAKTVKQAIHEAEQLRTKNETEVFTSFIALNRMLAQLVSVIKQLIDRKS
jgi:hypothetical protein